MAIKLGGKTDAQLGFKVLRDSIHPLLPNTRDRRTSITGRHGTYYFGSDLSGKEFQLECMFIQSSGSQVQTKARELADFLTDDTGRPRLLDLEFDYDSGKTYQVRVSGGIELDRVAGVGNFSMTLISESPFAFGAEKSILNTGSLYNGGNVEAYPIVTVEFTTNTTDFFIQRGTGGPKFTLKRPFILGSTLIIDMEQMTANVDGSNVLMALESGSEFWTIPPKTTVTPVHKTGVANVTYTFKERYI